MTKRILGLVLALCLIIGMLPVVALAEETEVAGTLKQFAITVDDGQQTGEGINWKENLGYTYYGKNATNGRSVSWTDVTEEDYTIKVEQTANGLEVTLRDAYLKTTASYVYTMRIRYEGKVTINLIGTNKLESGAVNSPARLYVNATEGATITGTGTLIANANGFQGSGKGADVNGDGTADVCYEYGSVIEADCDLTIKDATLDLDQVCTNSTNPWAGHGIRCSGDVTIDNAKVDIYAQYGNGIRLGTKRNTYGTAGNVTITNGAKVNIESNSAPLGFGDGKIYINNETGDTEVTLKGTNYAFYPKTPVLQGTYDAYYSTVKNGTGAVEYTAEASQAVASGEYRYFRYHHACVAGEPVYEKAEGGCATKQHMVTYCTVCKEEISRETTEVTDWTKIHTPGAKTLVEGSMTKPTNQGHYSVTEKGTYTLQCTCSVCGETWTETEEYLPAVMYYVTASNDYNSSSDKTVPKFELNSYWGDQGTGYTPTLTVLPGQTVYFATETGTNTNIPTNAYMRKLSTSTAADKAIIDGGTWHIKLEYPIGGTPVLTMQNATIINCVGLWYGYAGFYNMAPLTLVLKGKNTITQPRYTNGGGLNFKTMSPVTITGDGSLDLCTFGNLAGIRSYGGDLIFDHANIQYTHYTNGSSGDAVQTQLAGDIIVDGGTFNMVGANSAYQDAANGFNSKGDIVIKGGANVSLTNALAGKTYYMLNAAGNITISESTVKLACVYYGSAINYGGELTLEYVNGFTGNAIYARPTLDAETLKYTYPDLTEAVKLADTADVIANKDKYYLDIAPVKALANFTGTAVTIEDDLDVSFQLKAENVDTDGKVIFTVNGEEIEKSLSEVGKYEDNNTNYVITLPGLSAKDMQKEITVTVFDSQGNTLTETKSDSVQAYALRLLRDSKYAADTEINKALKTFLVDMLVYGSMAQVQFYNGDTPLTTADLVTAALTATELGYASTMKTTGKVEAIADNEGYVGTSFELKSNIGMAIALDATVLTDVLFATVTFTDYLGKVQNFDVVAMDASSNDKFTVFVFNELDAANGRKDVIWTFYDSYRAEVLTVTDSLAAYVGRMKDAYPYMDALMKYCDSAETYFILANAANS